MDEQGNNITPESNMLEFTASDKKSYETILKAEEIARFQLRSVYPDWQPDVECRQVAVTSVQLTGNTLSWTTNEKAKAFLIERGGDFVAIVDGTQTSATVPDATSEGYTVRAANMMGGFGQPTAVGQTSGVKAVVNGLQPSLCYYDLQGRRVVKPSKGVYVVNGKKVVVK
jgi:hypothetical protein